MVSSQQSIRELWGELVDKKRNSRSEATVAWYENLASAHLEPIAHRPVTKVTVREVEAWLEGRSHLSPSSLRKLRSALGQAFDIALQNRQINHNPVRLADVPASTVAVPDEDSSVLTLEEIERLRRAAAGHRLAAWLDVMLSSGLRPHESYELTWSDIDLKAGTLVARPRKAKARRARIVSVSPATRSALAVHRRRMLEEQVEKEVWPRDHDDLVFRSEAGTPLDGKNMNRLLRSWLASVDIDKRMRVYDLRHTFASHAAHEGVPITQLADYMGNDPQTLERHYRKPTTPVLDIGVDVGRTRELSR